MTSKTKIDMPLADEEPHKALDRILTVGDPMAQAIRDVIENGSLFLKAQSKKRQSAFAEGLQKFLDDTISSTIVDMLSPGERSQRGFTDVLITEASPEKGTYAGRQH